MKPVKLGIIGCGIAARDLHWPALKQLKDKFEIVCVCNHTEEKAREFSQMVGGVPYVQDYHKVLEMPDVEAVDIILPIELNYQVTKDAAEAGKHIIVEKPLAVNLEEARQMLGIEKGYSKILMVAENFRYRSSLQQLKNQIEQGKIGDVYGVFWNSFTKLNEENKYAQTKWRIDHKYPGGFVTDSGVHNIAALRDVFGEIYRISSFTKGVNREIGKLDSFSLQFTTEKRVSGVLNLFFSSNGYSEDRLIVLGSEGSIIIEDEVLTVKRNDVIEYTEKFENDNGYKGEFEDFYNAIRNGSKIKSSFFEAYSDLKVILDALSTSVTDKDNL